MNRVEALNYDEMNVEQRARFLLGKGVTAKIGIDVESMTPGYAAYVKGMGQLPVGFHSSYRAAIDAGTTWLTAKAQSSSSDAALCAEGAP